MSRPAPSDASPPRTEPDTAPAEGLGERLANRLKLAFLGLVMLLPYRWRVPFAGWLAQVTMGRSPRNRRRIARALHHLFPDLPEPEVRRLCKRVPNNMGRAVIEIWSGAEFAAHAARMPITGPGLAALEAAHTTRRPVLLVTAHFGNYDVARALLLARGYPVGGYYQPLPGAAVNRRYVAAIGAIGQPLFAAGRRGLAEMLRFLRGGGMLGILADLDRDEGVIEFLGKPARTALSIAEMALKYDALMVPIYGIRQPDGLSFEVFVDAPVPHGEPRVMMQAINDSLGRMVSAHKDQWLWWHKRWRADHPGFDEAPHV